LSASLQSLANKDKDSLKPHTEEKDKQMRRKNKTRVCWFNPNHPKVFYNLEKVLMIHNGVEKH